MKIAADISDIEAKAIAQITEQKGYNHIPSKTYVQDEDVTELVELQGSYNSLPPDEKGGQRFRCYKQLNLLGGQLNVLDTDDYSQDFKDNYDLGGQVRKMASMEKKVLNLFLLQKIIFTDALIAQNIGIVDFDAEVNVGLHQVRYMPTRLKPSFSSPPWLHKDTEPIVFIHLLHLSSNAVGGASIIAQDSKTFVDVLQLMEPMDTLCVTNHRNLHAVTPLGVSTGASAFRDILLVTFENQKPKG